MCQARTAWATKVVGALLGLGLLVGVAGSTATAAPITCPPGQEATKTDDWWACVNGGGNESNAAETKNPNDRR